MEAILHLSSDSLSFVCLRLCLYVRMYFIFLTVFMFIYMHVFISVCLYICLYVCKRVVSLYVMSDRLLSYMYIYVKYACIYYVSVSSMKTVHKAISRITNVYVSVWLQVLEILPNTITFPSVFVTLKPLFRGTNFLLLKHGKSIKTSSSAFRFMLT